MSSSKPARRGRHRDLQEGIGFAGMALAVNTLMAIFKVTLGVFTNSHALIANALYSINDIFSAIAIAISLKIGDRKPDEHHPFGYGKAEFVSIAIVSISIAIGVCFMFVFSALDIIRGVPGPPHFTAMSLAAVSIVVSGAIAKKGRKLAIRLQSPAIDTSAEHHHADAVGGVAALIGVGGALLGLHVLDRLVAIFETLHLVVLSGSLLGNSVKGLMDIALPVEDVELVKQACGEVEGVRKVRRVWSRRVGRDICIDLAVSLSSETSVAQAHAIRARLVEVVRSVLGPTTVTQVQFQSPRALDVIPAAGGSHHG